MLWDVVIAGAGAIGSSAAYHLAKEGLNVLVLERERAPGVHQSGRNSGVIHAGYNVAPGTKKAQFCVDGNRQMHAFCADHGVKVDPGGILVVAKSEQDQETLDVLQERARGNGVALDRVDAQGLQRIEPHARGLEAVHAPEASSVDAAGYVQALVAQAEASGATFQYSHPVRTWAQTSHGDDAEVEVHTSKGPVRARLFLNAAGLQADRLAQQLCPDLRIIPFRGFYAQLRPEKRPLVRHHIYAAPDLQFPFLGVHLSRRTDGSVHVGPGAMLAFGREAYRFWGVQPKDLWDTLRWPGFWKLMKDPRVQSLMRSEVAKSVWTRAIATEARALVPALQPRDLQRATAGNRAQMVDREGHLVSDIVVRETPQSVHVLNAVSPGLTCSLPFGAELAKQCMAKL